MRTFLIIVAVVIFAVVGLVWFALSNVNGLVETAIERSGTRATQTDVAVSGVDVRFTESKATISGLTIANPEGFSPGNAFELGGITVALNAEEMRAAQDTQTIVLSAIEVEAPKIMVEFLSDGSSNIKALQKNVSSLAGGQDAGGGGPRIIVDRLEIRSAEVTALAPGGRSYDLRLPAITMTDIGRSEGGLPGAELAAEILDEVSGTVLRETAKANVMDRLGLSGAGDAVRGLGEGVGGGVRDLLGR
ncbi:MAG: hypothetical protein HXY25_00340 [Alphaproteobacteria bacterium]|nr:hypothetical protein [Alphaproteobacteria bacterium]